MIRPPESMLLRFKSAIERHDTKMLHLNMEFLRVAARMDEEQCYELANELTGINEANWAALLRDANASIQ